MRYFHVTNQEVISIEHLHVYYGEILVLKDVHFNIYENDFLYIIGPNGSGKTTLLKTMLGFIKPQHGKIKIYGKALRYEDKCVAYVPQIGSIDRSFPISVIDNVLLGHLPNGLRPFFRFSKEDYNKANKALERLGIHHLKDRHISQMSGGEYQKSLIARAIVSEPKVLFLDEPTANVDHQSRSDIYELLKGLNEKMTIVMVTHDTLAVSSYAKKIACLDKTCVHYGTPTEVRETIEEIYNCPIEHIAHGYIPHRTLKTQKGVH